MLCIVWYCGINFFSPEMDVDGAANKAEVRRTAKKLLKLKKRRKSSIVFPKYGDRKVKGRK